MQRKNYEKRYKEDSCYRDDSSSFIWTDSFGAEMNTDTQVLVGEITEEGHPAGENVGEETQIPKTEDNNTEVGKTQENIPEEEADNLSEI